MNPRRLSIFFLIIFIAVCSTFGIGFQIANPQSDLVAYVLGVFQATESLPSPNLGRTDSPQPEAAFSAGNIVIYRVGSGSGSLVNTGNPVFLDEYTPTGTLVQSIAMPTTVSGSNKQLIASGTANSEGFLTRSSDGQYLILAGYASDLGGSTILSNSSSGTIPRTIGRVNGSGTIDTTTALTDAATGSNPRGSFSTNGTDLWISGGVGGIRYTTVGATSSVQLSTDATNLRVTDAFDGQLYVSTGAGLSHRIATVGTGVPKTSGQTMTNLPGFPTVGSPYAFYFADLSSAVPGVDTLYYAEESNPANINKYSLVSGNWVLKNSVSAPAARGLTATVSGTTVTIYATTGGTGSTGGGSLYKLTDTSGYNANINGTVTTIATASANTAFRGVALAPVAVVNVCDFCNLQFPSSLSVPSGSTTEQIYGQIFEAGVTESAGPSATVTAQVGYGPQGSDPRSAGGWSWFAASYNVQSANNDEYVGTFTAPAVGTYSYTFRYSLDGGTNWTYGDLDGNGSNPGLTFSTARLGVMTVTAATPTPTPTPTATPTPTPVTLLVDNLTDDSSLSLCTAAANDCSLRGANLVANDGDTITFDSELFSPQNSALTSKQAITLGGAPLSINSDVTINGPGANMLTIDANHLSRVMSIGSGATVHLQGLTIVNGNAGNQSGGGVLNSGDLSILECQILNNSTDSSGGGIRSLTGSTLIIERTTVSGNQAGSALGPGNNGGGVDSSGTSTIINSTISGNASNGPTGAGGGLWANGNTTILNSTITNNSVSVSGASGIFHTATGTVTIRSTIIAGNTDPSTDPDVVGAFVSSGFNLVGNVGSATGFMDGLNNDLVGTGAAPLDPVLSPLQDNAGPTLTHRPLLGSPAVDAGSAFGLIIDQRGFARTYDDPGFPNPADGTDIGAFEGLMPTAAPVSLSGRIRTSVGQGISNTIVTIAGGRLEQPRVARTNTFGYFTFSGLEPGAYFVTVQAKKYVIADPTRVVSLMDNMTGVDFVAETR